MSDIVTRDAHEFMSSDSDHYNAKWTFATAKQFFGVTELPASNIDANVLATRECLRDPDSKAEILNLYRQLEQCAGEDGTCIDYAHALCSGIAGTPGNHQSGGVPSYSKKHWHQV